MDDRPLVSVLMPAYNAALFIKEAIESILNQTYTNWELIILNDGSTDSTIDIINAFKDLRIILYENKGNKGLIFTRNKLIELAHGDYIAWLDADDIALSKRIENQVKILNKIKEIAILGGGVQPIDQHGNDIGKPWKYDALKEAISSILFFKNYFAQSSIMVRRSALSGISYGEDYPLAEDYDLWVRLLEKYLGGNLREIVVKYRTHPNNITHRDSEKMSHGIKKIRRYQFRALIPDNSVFEEVFVNNFSNTEFKMIIQIMLKLELSNKNLNKYPLNIFGAVILKQLLSKIKRDMNFNNILLLLKTGFLKYTYTMLLYKV